MSAASDLDRPLPLAQAGSARFFFRGQLVHVAALAPLVPVAWAFAAPALGDQHWLGLVDHHWYWATVVVAIIHQWFVWAAWRAQLGWQLLTRWLGSADMAAYGVVFFLLLVARPLTLVGLAISDSGSMALPAPLAVPLGVLLLCPSLYTLWSVQRYFGFRRAMGGDHFRERYRRMPLVREGAFRWTPNAMYTLAFLLAWAIALLAGSLAALAAAFFHHAYIWIHYLATEAPDMELLYGDPPSLSEQLDTRNA